MTSNLSSRPSDALAYLITWTTYGTWLPGDQRGWIRRQKGDQIGDEFEVKRATTNLNEQACKLDLRQRQIVSDTISRHCEIRGWKLHAANCRTNHVHVVISATEHPKVILSQLKAWTSRRLSEHGPRRDNWWTERGSGRYLFDDLSLEAAIVYVLEAQDRK